MLKGNIPVKFDTISLHKNMSIPSEIHVYSLGIEYMRQWFLEKFEKDYFKTVFVNGKHIMDDFRQFNRQQIIKREKPALAIIPSVDYDYNRDTLDLQLGGREVLSKFTDYFDDSIIRDYDNNLFLGMNLKQVQMNFTFRIRVGSRAEQIDLYNFMKYAFRVGATQAKYVSYDFHIPYEIILNMAKHNNFEIVKSVDEKKRPVVKDVTGFLKYLNKHSIAPVLYKMRTINGNPEYFIRMDNLYTHISNLDQLSLDDGEREGQLDNNFHIEMNCILKIPAPQYYYYYSRDDIERTFKAKKEFAGLYEFKVMSPPEKNDNGWEEYVSTQWTDDSKHIDTICFKELLQNNELNQVITHNIDTGLSPRIFMDIKLFNGYKELPIKIDWENYEIVLNEDVEDEVSYISIYVDLEYVNGQLIVLNGLQNDNNRMNIEDRSKLKDIGAKTEL